MLLCTKIFILFPQSETPSFSTMRWPCVCQHLSCQQRFQQVITTINPAFTTRENEPLLHQQHMSTASIIIFLQQLQSSLSQEQRDTTFKQAAFQHSHNVQHLQFVFFSSVSIQQSPFPGMCLSIPSPAHRYFFYFFRITNCFLYYISTSQSKQRIQLSMHTFHS